MLHLLYALARRWTFLRRVLVRLAVKQERHDQEGRSAEARARFWADLHQGQREAEAQASKLHP